MPRSLCFVLLFLTAFNCSGPASPEGERLRNLAPPDFGIGAVLHGYSSSWSHPPYQATANAEFNAVTATAYMAYGPWPDPDVTPDTSGLTAVTTWSRQRGKRVHGHVLVYPAANTDLAWFQALPDSEVEGKLEEYVTAAAQSTAGEMWVWDVVNEVIGDPGDLGNPLVVDADGVRKAFYKNGVLTPLKEYTALGQGYIADAFAWAEAADPDALLIINDYGAEELNPKSDALLAFAVKLRDQGVPIDGVGFQMHWLDPGSLPDYASIRANLQRFADEGFQLFVTEVDVAALHTTDPSNVSPTAAQLERQKGIYKELLRIALEQPACKSFLMWDFADDQSWVHPTRNPLGSIPTGTYMYPTPFAGGGSDPLTPIAAKSAYTGLQEALTEHTAVARLTTDWEPASSYLARDGVPDGAGGYDPGDTASLYTLDPVSETWSSMKWALERVSEGIYRIRNQWDDPSGYLTRDGSGSGASGTPGTSVSVQPLAADPIRQQWRLEPTGDGGFRILNAWHAADGYLTRDGIPLGGDEYDPGPSVSLYPRESWSSQVWRPARTD